MIAPRASAATEARRQAMRAQNRLNGIDFVDPGEDPRSLMVVFFHPPPRHLAPEHFVITGGVRVPTPPVIEVRLHDPADKAQEPFAQLVFAHAGDASAYRLVLHGLSGFDPRFSAVDFSFGHASGLRPPLHDLPDMRLPPPELDYLAKDDTGFRRVAFGRLAQTLPGWNERHAPDLGVMLVEMMAYVGDQLSLYQDAVATEAYLGTARLRGSVRRHARLIDYAMHEGCNARAWLHLTTDVPLTLQPGDIAFAVSGAPDFLEFAPVDTAEIRLDPALVEIAFYGWGESDAGLSVGAVTATLRDGWADAASRQRRLLDGLRPGQALLIEAAPDDFGPVRSHVVRLRQVTRDEDPLFEIPVVEIVWAAEDALPFAADLSQAVARGNMILVDHGRTVAYETVVARPDAAYGTRPTLRRHHLTFCEPIDPLAPASLATIQDPRKAAPQVLSLSAPPEPELALPDQDTVAWVAQTDLIESGAEDFHVVVEMDDEGGAALRFGDGRMGARPGPGPIQATYRVGNGPSGNVGAGAIDLVLQRGSVALDGVGVRNPLPAAGGTRPEPIINVKRLAPGSFKLRQERAITADDYTAVAEEVFGVRRAHADIMRIGMARLARVAILPQGSEDASPELLARVEAHLQARRRIGHDIQVLPARTVALEVEIAVGVPGNYLRAHVLSALRAVLSSGLRPDGAPGLFHPDNLSFGEPVIGSRIVTAAQNVTGIEWVRLVRLRRLLDPMTEDEAEMPGTVLLGPAEVARMDNDPARPEHGRLIITMEGGR